MFERYTEKARRVIFFARYEASQFGSPYIETEHLLLGILREDKALTHCFIAKATSAAAIRKKIESATTIREKIETSVDLPLSNECRRVLAYAAEEAERLSHKHIGTEHLFLGLLREEKSFAAQILVEIGLNLEAVRAEVAKGPPVDTEKTDVAALLSPLRRDLTAMASENKLDPFLGREKEMHRLIQVLGRSARKNVILVADPGSGRRALVEGLAHRTAQGDVPSFLEQKRVVEFDIDQLRGGWRGAATEWLLKGSTNIFFLEDLVPLLAGTPPADFPAGGEILKALISDGKIQCICSATDEQHRDARKQHGWVDRWFTAIKIPAMTEAESIAAVTARIRRLETFHGVTFDPSLPSDAVRYSSALIKDRALPVAAIDLLDEAAAHALAQSPRTPDEIREVQKRIRFIVHRMEVAIANSEVEKARFYAAEERKEREGLRQLQQKHKVEAAVVTREDIEEVLAQWIRIPVVEIRKKVSSDDDTPAKT
ncbi:MAG TPA: Clp protease N-terminal domain-containing protein [Candidatus Angelobacter sp.]|nr:Clp protease N-terminal domain-containing protein [Candidatus Angelobacter sp.]